MDKKKNKSKRGFTIIETMVFLFIFMVTVMTMYNVFTMGIKYMMETKLRMGATAVANEKMEIIRSLEYENIGTVSGIPEGDILQEEVVVKNNSSYTAKTFIEYVDDPTDDISIAEGGSDDRYLDYKRVRVEVSWEEGNDLKKVDMYGYFASPGMEPPPTGGIMSINVLDSQGNGIPGALVKVENIAVSPSISMQNLSDSTGNVFLYEMPESNQDYKITISKFGYFSAETFAPYPLSTFNPTDLHASVTEGDLSVKSIIFDKYSHFNLMTKDMFGSDIINITFDLKGGRLLGTTQVTPPQEPENIYSYEETGLTTGSSSQKNFTEMHYGKYEFAFSDSTFPYQFVSIHPNISNEHTFEVLPGENAIITAYFAKKDENSLLMKVVNDADGAIIEGAEVTLKNEILPTPYSQTLVSDANGYVFFPLNTGELISGDYELSVAMSGYNSHDSTVTISGLVNEEVRLTLP